MEAIFLNAAGTVLFVRDDMESGDWTQEEYSVNMTFPFDSGKVIHRGMRVAFRDPATNTLEMFEIRNVTNIEPDHYQQIIGEHIVLSELSDEHINTKEITNRTPAQALTIALSGTQWAVGIVDIATDAERNRIIAEINALGLNGNVDLTNRPIISPETMHNAGYTDFDGDYATLFSMTFTETLSGGQLITTLFTPIRENGTVLSQEQIDSYVIGLHNSSSSITSLKAQDSLGLLIHAMSGEHITEMDAIAETAHDLSDEWETTTTGGVSSVDFARGSVWQAVLAIERNWNVYITPRVTLTSAGAISGRYLDIAPAVGVWRGVRLSVDKNMEDSSVVYDDSEVLTALYGYGGMVDVPNQTAPDTQTELNFKNVVWTATDEHPAKPAGQAYLEDPAKTALYGRNGRARFGYYQNADIKDANVLLQKTWETLKQTSVPKISISGTVADLYRMGYTDQPLRLHDTVIVDIPQTGETFQKEIIRLNIDLIDPTASRPEIGDYIQNIIYINRETNKQATTGGKGGGGGGRGQNNETKYLYDTYSGFEKNTNEYGSMIAMVVGKYDGVNYIKAGEIGLAINRSGQSGQYESTAYINADHVNIGANNSIHSLVGSVVYDPATNSLVFKEPAGGLVVERTEQGITSSFGIWDSGNVSAGMIATVVNGVPSTYIKGDKIIMGNGQNAETVINGKLTTSELSSKIADLTDVTMQVVDVQEYIDSPKYTGTEAIIDEIKCDSLTVYMDATMDELSCTSLAFGSGTPFTDCIINATVNSAGDTLTLYKASAPNTPINFRKATRVSGTWSGRTYTAIPDANGAQSVSTTVILAIEGSPNPDTSIYAKVYKDAQTQGNEITTTQMTLTESVANKEVTLTANTLTKGKISTQATWDAGFSAGAPTSLTLGTLITGRVYNVSVARGGYTAVTLQLNLNSVYTEAYNAGYNAGLDACGKATGYSGFYQTATSTYLYSSPYAEPQTGQYYNIASNWKTYPDYK